MALPVTRKVKMTWEELLEWLQKMPPEKRREKVVCLVCVERFNRTVKTDNFNTGVKDSFHPHLIVRI